MDFIDKVLFWVVMFSLIRFSELQLQFSNVLHVNIKISLIIMIFIALYEVNVPTVGVIKAIVINYSILFCGN